jgi:GTP-binding protein Era
LAIEKQERPIPMPDNFQAGYVALIGRPNVGKSTLLNNLLDFKLSIVTPKPQTTRKRILGILNEKNFQIVFIDTPGLIKPEYDMQQIMMGYLKDSIKDADIIVYMCDVLTKNLDFQGLEAGILPQKKPVILLINKIDLINKEKLLEILYAYKNFYKFSAYIPISATQKDGIEILLEQLQRYLPQHPPYYPPDELTDQPERFFVSEIIREKLFQHYRQEIPYSCHVEIEEFMEKGGRKDYIRAVIIVDQMSQKGILIGKKGDALKRVGKLARKDIEILLKRPVFLELYVKVIENWRKKTSKLRNLGY